MKNKKNIFSNNINYNKYIKETISVKKTNKKFYSKEKTNLYSIKMLVIIFFIFIINYKKLIEKYNIIYKPIKYKNTLKNNLLNINITRDNISNIQIENLNDLINKLNKYSYLREPKNIIINDLFTSNTCSDFNGYYLFEYYLENNYKNVYYIININNDLYQTILKKNKNNISKNLILYENENNTKNDFIYNSLWKNLFKYLLDGYIIIQSYTFNQFLKILNNVPYLKYLRINHGIRYFKTKTEKYYFSNLNYDKRNMISSSPYEYSLFISKLNYSKKHIYKAGLPRHDRFEFAKKNKTEKDCILISFTYRTYNNKIYQKSLLKKNLISLLNNKELINFLKIKNIDLIYIPHHIDILFNRVLNERKFKYAKKGEQYQIAHFIEQCSLCVTDFSSISYEFMFQNKPTLFYLIDLKEKFEFQEKDYMKNKTIYFGNVFEEENEIVQKIKYYTDRKFNIEKDLKKKYESLFFYKKNIRKRIVQIINKIIEN